MNQLYLEKSPYLLQHKNNPVHWQAWSKEALQKAKDLNKPILVSIGYSTCHWCHVMAHESFENESTAQIMNRFFINIKIDREERPDLDHYFMDAIQSMGISGGWPLNCFLTPDAKPFFGGTYFPPEPKYNRPSWSQILMSIHKSFSENPMELEVQAITITNHLKKIHRFEKSKNPATLELNIPIIYSKIESAMDLAEGGFGSSPKFPNTQAIQLLFYINYRTGLKNAKIHAVNSLKYMSMGGIYDHIGGGFCRYSVDRYWNVPHFEKMLYDHAQIMMVLSSSYHFTKSVFIKHIAEKSFLFFETEMKDSCGLFFAGIDADSEGEEGSYYVWNKVELQSSLKDHYETFFETYSLSDLDHFHTDKKVLRLKNIATSDQQIFQQLKINKACINQLQDLRKSRVKPSIDSKLIIAWNAMMISAYVSWYLVTGEGHYYITAKSQMDQLINLGINSENKICRYIINGEQRGYGFLEDYVYTMKALLDLYAIEFQKTYLDLAIFLFKEVNAIFKNETTALYKMSSSSYPDFEETIVDWAETSYPNPNAILCRISRYLYELTLEDNYKKIETKMLQEIQHIALQHPLSMASWIQDLLQNEYGYGTVKTDTDKTYIEMCQSNYLPDFIRLPMDSQMKGISFCFNGQCYAPVKSQEEIISLMSKHQIELG